MEALKLFNALAALAENDVYSALLELNEVATDELKSPVTLATLADNAVDAATLALNLLSTDCENALTFPIPFNVNYVCKFFHFFLLCPYPPHPARRLRC